jgi:hypothetical protein|tara:strand:+ start:1198 stop:1497 length:300 start_codon:yes stop_codon:yes gene_type:complete
MANPQSMTLSERMNTINGDGTRAYTFQEACNKYVKTNISGYSTISLNKYTPQEAFSIIRAKPDMRSHTLEELINDMGSYGLHEYTATESLNKQASITEG